MRVGHMPDSFSVIRNTATVGVGVAKKENVTTKRRTHDEKIVQHARMWNIIKKLNVAITKL